MIYFKFLKEI